jgi:hypothetical protein
MVDVIGEVSFHVQGDIGGIGVSRFWFAPQTPVAITQANANAVAAAGRAFLQAASASMPAGISWTCDAQVNVYDVHTGLVQGPIVISALPAAVTGAGGSGFPAGVGARVNWKTAQVQGRRLIRGAIFVAPLSNSAFTTSGAVSSTFVTSQNAAAATYLGAVTTANLNPIIWHRPPKGTFAGGALGIVFAGVTSSVPASLRSRRT